MSAGKGDKPRNCFSQKFKNNFGQISWDKKKPETSVKSIKGKKVYFYK